MASTAKGSPVFGVLAAPEPLPAPPPELEPLARTATVLTDSPLFVVTALEESEPLTRCQPSGTLNDTAWSVSCMPTSFVFATAICTWSSGRPSVEAVTLSGKNSNGSIWSAAESEPESVASSASAARGAKANARIRAVKRSSSAMPVRLPAACLQDGFAIAAPK